MKLVPVLNVTGRAIVSPKHKTTSYERVTRIDYQAGTIEFLVDTVEVRHRRRIVPKWLVRLVE